jgi:hypothetical protein
LQTRPRSGAPAPAPGAPFRKRGSNFYEFYEATGSSIAAEALHRIGELYVIEERIRGWSAALRMAERRTFSKPFVEKLKVWLEKQLSQVPRRGRLADAIRCALSRWDGLTRFLHDGRVELDTNTVERAIRPVALGRKNHLFAGSDEGGARWATLCSLIETCKMNDVEPYAYLRDVLQRTVDGHPVNRLDELLPWNWKLADLSRPQVTCSLSTLTVGPLRPRASLLNPRHCAKPCETRSSQSLRPPLK